MHILVLTDRFYPEITAPSVRILDHARVWLADGHEVTVVTGAPNFPRGVIFDGYRNQPYQRETIEGVNVIRLWSYLAPNKGFSRRILDWTSLAATTALASPILPRADVVLATSPPIFTPVAGLAVSRLRKLPWVFEVRDLWPASIRAVGAAGDGAMLDMLEKMELWLYGHASRVVVLTDAFREDLISRGITDDKIDVVRNAVDLNVFDPEQVTSSRAELLNLPDDRFVVGYVGTTGMAHGLDNVLDTARRLADRPEVILLILGEGAERAGLEERARDQGLDNVVFRNFVPHDKMPAVLASLDASLVHLRPDPLFRTVIPSKIFEGMAMGVPLLHCVEGESATIVSEAEAGLCVAPGDPDALAAAIRRLADDPELRAKLGAGGHAAAARDHNRASAARAMITSLEAARQAHAGRH